MTRSVLFFSSFDFFIPLNALDVEKFFFSRSRGAVVSFGVYRPFRDFVRRQLFLFSTIVAVVRPGFLNEHFSFQPFPSFSPLLSFFPFLVSGYFPSPRKPLLEAHLPVCRRFSLDDGFGFHLPSLLPLSIVFLRIFIPSFPLTYISTLRREFF